MRYQFSKIETKTGLKLGKEDKVVNKIIHSDADAPGILLLRSLHRAAVLSGAL